MNGSRQVFECVPNFSEGRNLALISDLAQTAREAGVYVADVTSDSDHHRSVMTWFGSTREIIDACSNCLEQLAEDYRCHGRTFSNHRGVHPRTGLLDVAPLVPLDALDPRLLAGDLVSTMADAQTAATELGHALAAAHELPIYRYENAATAEDRRNLADHRRALTRTDPTAREWRPDHGPDQPHPIKGAVLVGARNPLIAFNLDLTTNDPSIARAIASRIRATARTGLPGVKALGLMLDHRGCAQVSVNLVDANATDLPTLIERVGQEAQSLGTDIRRGELIGLATEVAIGGASAEELLLPDLDPGRRAAVHVQRALDAREKQRR